MLASRTGDDVKVSVYIYSTIPMWENAMLSRTVNVVSILYFEFIFIQSVSMLVQESDTRHFSIPSQCSGLLIHYWVTKY